jgi:hypothetical protein
LISYATMVSRPDRLDIGHYFDARDQIWIFLYFTIYVLCVYM